MSQTSYSYTMSAAIAGMLADASPKAVDTGINKDSASVPFGVFVAFKSGQDAGDQACAMPSGSTDKLKGVVLYSNQYAVDWTDPSGAHHGELDATGLRAGASLNVLRRGRVYMTSESNFAYGDPVFVRYSANGGNTQLGAVRNADDSGHTIDATSKARYVSSGSAGDLAIIEIDTLT